MDTKQKIINLLTEMFKDDLDNGYLDDDDINTGAEGLLETYDESLSYEENVENVELYAYSRDESERIVNTIRG